MGAQPRFLSPIGICGVRVDHNEARVRRWLYKPTGRTRILAPTADSEDVYRFKLSLHTGARRPVGQCD